MSRHSTAWGIFAGALTALLWVVSIPPFEFAEAAYITFVPLLLWLSTKPARRVVTWVSFGTGLLAWCAILIWLRHVTIFGTLALSAVLAAYFCAMDAICSTGSSTVSKCWVFCAALWVRGRSQRLGYIGVDARMGIMGISLGASSFEPVGSDQRSCKLPLGQAPMGCLFC